MQIALSPVVLHFFDIYSDVSNMYSITNKFMKII